MKKWVASALMIGFVALLWMSFGQQVGGYMGFRAAETAETTVHVVGDWVEEKPTAYDRRANTFTFWMRDKNGTVRRVVYDGPRPSNFKQAEQVVVQGKMDGGTFRAKSILVKCPSKYKSEKLK